MKILTARNGIALVAVLAILLITSLFIPVMFSMGESSLAIAVKGADRQRSNYFARTITEMSVAAFKSFDSDEYVKLSPEARATYYTNADETEKATLDELNKVIVGYDALLNGSKSELITETVVMLTLSTDNKAPRYYKIIQNGEETIRTEISYKKYKDLLIAYEEMVNHVPAIDPGYTLEVVENSAPEETIVYANKNSTEYNDYVNLGYKPVGEGYCTIKYDNSIKYYKTITDSQVTTEIEKDGEGGYDALKKELEAKIEKNQLPDYSLSVQENKNLEFTSTATVNNFTSSKTCVLVLQTYPSEEDWFEFGVISYEMNSDGTFKKDAAGNKIPKNKIPFGGNQVFVDPDKATSRVPIEYDQSIDSTYLKQTLLVYSSTGNMIIKPTKFKDALSGSPQQSGVNNTQFVLGIQPGLNTTPNDDPSFEIIDGVNYNKSKEIAEMNNFVAFTSNSAIQVDMPINILVNPCRANRLGDGNQKNGSLYKIMIFQSPTIQFNGRLDMMMSFYQRSGEDANRMSSIVLSAPEDTPYTYVNDDRGKVVKAGMVYFTEDCYLWIIPYGEDGSSSSWTGFFSETVYERDSDFTKIKIASAGDVYQFNSEIEVNGERVGLSLTGYYLETEYIPKLKDYEQGDWWQVWNNTKQSFFQASMNQYFANNPVYVKDDFKYYGNIFDQSTKIEPPELDEYYSYWVN